MWGVSEAETPSQPSTVTRPNISLVLAGKAETRDVNITSLSPRVCQTMRPPPSPASHTVIRVQSCKIFATHVSIIWRIFGILNRLCGGGGSAVSWWRVEGGGDQTSAHHCCSEKSGISLVTPESDEHCYTCLNI